MLLHWLLYYSIIIPLSQLWTACIVDCMDTGLTLGIKCTCAGLLFAHCYACLWLYNALLLSLLELTSESKLQVMYGYLAQQQPEELSIRVQRF